MNPEDYTMSVRYDDYLDKKDGWIHTPTQVRTKSIVVHRQELASKSTNVKYALNIDLIKELNGKGYIKYTEKQVPLDLHDPLDPPSIRYSAEIYVADYGVTSKIIDIDEFEVQGVKFTEEQLIHAVKNTFPEELI